MGLAANTGREREEGVGREGKGRQSDDDGDNDQEDDWRHRRGGHSRIARLNV